jgi:ferredoxin-NADP reductase
MATHEVKLRRSEQVAAGTMAFAFDRPASFAFKPGQAIDVVLPGLQETDAENARHTFSLVSAPFENELVIATRMRDSAYKRALKALPIGASVAIEGPFGSLTLHGDRTRAAVVIAGGIGITPFMSMLRQATHDRRSQRFVVLCSNRRAEEATYLAELEQLERDDDSFRLIATITQPGNGSGQRQTGRIDAAMIRNAVAGLNSPVYYVAGPPGWVEAMRRTLNDEQVSDDDIRSEDFFGY